MPSASPRLRVAVLGLCGCLAAGGVAGCSTTQEKAAAQRAASERILGAREKRQQRRRQGRQGHHGKSRKEKR